MEDVHNKLLPDSWNKNSYFKQLNHFPFTHSAFLFCFN